MTESTSEYKKRIEEIKQSIENEPYMAKMREDIAEGISKTGIRQATVEEQFQSILDETTGKDVISAPEIIVARGGAQTLGERLDSEKADLETDIAVLDNKKAEKTALNDTNNNVIGLQNSKVDKEGNEQVTLAMLSQQVKEIIAGTNALPVAADNSINTSNYVNKSIIASKIADFTIPTTKLEEYTSNLLAKKKIGKNLFNPAKSVDGFYVNHTNGQLYANPEYFYTEKIFAEPGTVISKNILERVAFFTINKNEFVSGIAPGESTFTMPEDCYFFQTNGQISIKDKFQIEKGNSTTSFEPYSEFIDGTEIGEKTVSTKTIIEPIVVGRKSNNVLENNKVKKGIYVESTNGREYPNANFFATDYQTCEVGRTINKNNNERIAFYDDSYNFVSGVAKPVFSVKMPPGCKYYRTSGELSILDTFMIQIDTNFTDYESPGGIVEYSQLAPNVRKKIDREKDFGVLLPSTIYAIAGEQVSLYYYNILKQAIQFDKNNYSLRFQKKNGSNYEKFGTGLDYIYYFTTTTDMTLTVKLFDDTQNKEIYSKDIAIKVADKTANVTPKNVIWIGDSFSEDYKMVQNTSDLLVAYNKNVNFLGTRQTSGEIARHDAFTGASVSNYFGATISSVVNPFYNPTSETFDFAYYMTNNQSGVTIDYFAIALGINDITRSNTDAPIELAMTRIQSIIDSVHSFDPTIKILVRTINPQAQNNVRWENSYADNFMRVGRLKYMQEKWNEAIINQFDNKTNIIVLHDGASLDTRYGLNTETLTPVKFMPEIEEIVTKDTHPNQIGSKQLADVFAYAISY
ncbi:MAG TPA: SGNH/GDSL hydrolase family protein [Candidatus Jeotgalibaca merdavium]|uniref:SGNH/GDSL hydrolase family protein n=1 Tax=Candidatus Jeotgalibaca merdavium TaxID=2838627 RepID=A0A9D2I321_9LACT|nr:SGNH/GDSL hydrolase family protein [Candidatus Jeotgalibaca merdavium]